MNLRQVLSQLNQHLSPYLTITRQTIAFNQAASSWVDVTEFEAGVTARSDIGRLQAAAALYQGDFLDGFYLDDAPHFDGWVLGQRARLRQAALAVLHHLVTHFADQGAYETAITYIRQLLAIEPWQEEAHWELMRLLALSGQRSAALVQYEMCRRILAEEMDVEPSAETQALYEAIRAGQVQQGAGEQGSRGEVVHLRTPALAHNLPSQATPFIGREQEVAEVSRLLSASRLVTLTGPGGCGKTRLVLQAAAGVLETFADGAWFVELAPLSEAALVPQAVATALDVREVGDRPLLSLLLNYLRTRRLLLILDNCEHLVEAAAQLAEALLRHCPQLQILATSREALNIAGESAWLVPPLSLPEAGEQMPLDILRQADAIRLFTERATAVLPGFSLTGQNATVVEQVCRRLDGIPLAIELAAARVKMLRVEQIAARLDDRFHLLVGGSRTALPRHQTLQALIDWSYNLLTPSEQRLLRWLSVFAGGFTLEAVEAVCAGKDEADALEQLGQLVNKSLVVMKREPGQEARYHLLETIRQYALEKLKEEGEAGLAQARHLNFFLQLAETAEPWLDRAEQIVWLDRLEREHDNLRVALAWSLENQDGDLESGLRLATALVEFWLMRAHWREGVRWLDVALAKRHGAAPPVQARLLLKAGSLRLVHSESDSTALLEESLALYRQLDDKRGMAWSLGWLGWCVRSHKRDVVAATSLFLEGLSLARDVDDKPLLIWLYYHLGGLAAEKGDDGQATELTAKGLALVRETGERQKKGWLLMTLGSSAAGQRDYARATAFLQEALALARELKSRGTEATILNSWGEVMRFQRAYEEAAVFYQQSLALLREVDNRKGITTVLNNLGLVALGQDDRPQARSLFRESMALAQKMKDKRGSFWNVWGLARVALAEGHTRRAVQLFAATGRLMEIFGISLDPVDQDDYERDVALARAQLGEEDFATAWAEGQAMSLEEAIAYALEE
jgi:predicted ATPase/DNA-binding SARP family transcriptional activator